MFTAYIFVLLALALGARCQYLVEVLEDTSFGTQRPVMRCEATGANFGMDVLEFSFSLKAVGCAISTEPKNACAPAKLPHQNSTSKCDSFFAVVPRGNCSFSEKAYFAQTADPDGYDAVIVYAAPGQSPIPMSGSVDADKVQIPVVMVNYKCMINIMGQYSVTNGYMLTLKASPGYYDLIKYLVPFVVIVGFCFVVLFISLVIRLCRERRRLARKRLSRSNLKKIPIKKYKKGDWPETCAICLEDFVEGEKIRVLPCRHSYHCKCIDPWLTKNRKVCPICKRKVGPSNGSDSDSDTERSAQPPTTTREDDPLIRNEGPHATSSSANFLGRPSPGRPRFPLRWLRSFTNNPTPTESDQPGPSRASSDTEVDEELSLPRRAVDSIGRGISALRGRLSRSENPHSRLENDDSLSTTVSEVEVDPGQAVSTSQTVHEVVAPVVTTARPSASQSHVVQVEVEMHPEV